MSTDDTAIMCIGGMDITSTGARATTFIGRITQHITVARATMSTGARDITSTGEKGITSTGARATISTDAKGITFIAYDMQRRDIVRCTHVGRM